MKNTEVSYLTLTLLKTNNFFDQKKMHIFFTKNHNFHQLTNFHFSPSKNPLYYIIDWEGATFSTVNKLEDHPILDDSEINESDEINKPDQKNDSGKNDKCKYLENGNTKKKKKKSIWMFQRKKKEKNVNIIIFYFFFFYTSKISKCKS